MNTLSKASPLKRKQQQASAPIVKPRALLTLGVEGWPCPDDNCTDGLRHEVAQNIWKDETSCKVSLSLLKPSKDHPHECSLCLKDVGGTPSLGTDTGETDSRGYSVWDNIHGVFSHCAGAKTSDGKRFKNATIAGSEHIGKLCHSYDPEQPAAIDLDSGCTGVIADGDLVVKDWDEPPLHLLCAKREWRKTVISILRKKQQLRDLDSTEKQEAAQPSAEVPANLADF